MAGRSARACIFLAVPVRGHTPFGVRDKSAWILQLGSYTFFRVREIGGKAAHTELRR